MGQNTKTTCVTAERLVVDIRRKTRKRYSNEARSELYLPDYAAKTALLSCAVRKVFRKGSITAGRRSFLRLARSGLPVT